MTTPFADLSLHYVGEEALLLDPTRQRLYALNACAGFICTLLKDGKSPAEVGRLLNEQLEVPVETAASYVECALRQYDDLVSDKVSVEPVTAVPVNGQWRPRPRNDAAIVEAYSMLNALFRVHYESTGLFASIHPLLRHGTPASETRAATTIDLDVVCENDGVAVLLDQRLIARCRWAEQAAAMLRACLTELAVMKSGGLCAIHAGALRRNGRALLLPGDAGYGKSTLSAGLAACGFDMLSDDTTLIEGEPPLVRSIRAGLCIKRGAYAVLELAYPQLPSLPEWRRPDGRWVRYLMPGEHVPWAEADAALAVGWIVFPRYSPDQRTALLPLSRHEALAHLLRGACFLSGALDERSLETLIAWIERIECFELPLSSLDAATSLLDELCR